MSVRDTLRVLSYLCTFNPFRIISLLRAADDADGDNRVPYLCVQC